MTSCIVTISLSAVERHLLLWYVQCVWVMPFHRTYRSVITTVIVFHLLQTIALTLIFFLMWTIYGFLASGVVVIYIELMLSCDKLEYVAGPLGLNDPYLCLPLATGLSESL